MSKQTTMANPAPLGLAGFGMTTILLNIHNAGFFELNVMIMAMGIFYGGFCQIIAGILDWKRGNMFGGLAFTSYGSFWLTLVFIWTAPKLGLPASSHIGLAWYLAMWGLFTFCLFFGTLKGPLIGKLVFSTLTILFALLSAANFAQSHSLHVIAGYVGILCGSLAFYEAIALVLNDKYGKTVLPL